MQKKGGSLLVRQRLVRHVPVEFAPPVLAVHLPLVFDEQAALRVVTHAHDVGRPKVVLVHVQRTEIVLVYLDGGELEVRDLRR